MTSNGSMTSNLPSDAFDFDRSTQVVPRDTLASRDAAVSLAAGGVSFDTVIHDGWDIMGNANGGYVLAVVARALTVVTGRPDCISVTCHYLAPCPAGPAVIDVVPVRSGRRFAIGDLVARCRRFAQSDRAGDGDDG
jgi:hypothetical protein